MVRAVLIPEKLGIHFNSKMVNSSLDGIQGLIFHLSRDLMIQHHFQNNVSKIMS